MSVVTEGSISFEDISLTIPHVLGSFGTGFAGEADYRIFDDGTIEVRSIRLTPEQKGVPTLHISHVATFHESPLMAALHELLAGQIEGLIEDRGALDDVPAFNPAAEWGTLHSAI